MIRLLATTTNAREITETAADAFMILFGLFIFKIIFVRKRDSATTMSQPEEKGGSTFIWSTLVFVIAYVVLEYAGIAKL